MLEKAAIQPFNGVAVLNAIPGRHVILLADAPRFTIVGVTDEYLNATYLKREDAVGRGFFDTLADHLLNGEISVVESFEVSLNEVLVTRQEHRMNDQRCQILNPTTGQRETRILRPLNKPVLDDKGDVQYIIHSIANVTETVQAEQVERTGYEKIVESEKNLRNTILQSPVAMCILRGPSYIVEIANHGMYELWGTNEEALGKRPIFEGLPELAGKGLEQLLAEVYSTGRPHFGKAHPLIVRRNGVSSTIYVDFVYQPIKESDGTITGIIAVATDVTEQVVALKILEESEENLQLRVKQRTTDLEKQKVFIESILEATSDGIYALKAVKNADSAIIDFQYLFANRNIAIALHLDETKIIGSSMLTLIPENRTNGFFELFCKVLETGETLRDETHFVTASIDNWYEYVIVPIDKETVVVSVEDISAKKFASIEIEDQRSLLDNILKNTSNGISVSKVFRDENENVVDALTILANDAAIRYIGLPKDIYLSKKATEIEPNIIQSPYYQQCIKTLETGEPFMTQYCMESTNRWLELTTSKLDHSHLIHVFTDVTQIKKVQLELEKYVEDLKRSNQKLEEFAYAASHDLKEPIRKIQTFSNRLKNSLRDRLLEEDQHYFDRMQKATDRMQLLIQDLLEYSHVSTSNQNVDKIDLNHKVALVLEDLELEIAERKAKVIVDVLPVIIGHRRQIQQLFQNLITNALKFSKPNVSPEIRISSTVIAGNNISSLKLDEDSKKQLFNMIEISDNGIGFEQEYSEKIFKMFQRLHGKAEYEGTGIGLAIVSKVVENHRGLISAESAPGEGAKFKVYLPVASQLDF